MILFLTNAINSHIEIELLRPPPSTLSWDNEEVNFRKNS